MSTPIRTLRELADEVQELIDSTGKHVYAEDLQDVLDRVVLEDVHRAGIDDARAPGSTGPDGGDRE